MKTAIIRKQAPTPPDIESGSLGGRIDHRSGYFSDHVTNRIELWDIQPSYGFAEQPRSRS